MEEKTITAISTATGGGVGMIRISGNNALEIALKTWKPINKKFSKPNARQMYLGNCYENEEKLDHALLVFMPAPNSYTGENVVEIQSHGGTLVLNKILANLQKNGAELATAGEFTKRAFVNGKLDLTQVEAVADLISAQSNLALLAANKQLDGFLGEKINKIYSDAEFLLAEIEVQMDFVDEDLDFENQKNIQQKIYRIISEISQLLLTKKEGEIIRNGVKIVLAGLPNAGKSSLMNLFLGRNRAIVTAIAGTTRDVLEENTLLRGINVRLLDTAGIRESSDEVEKIGVERSLQSLEEADIILWVIDTTQKTDLSQFEFLLKKSEKLVVVLNKIDAENLQNYNFSNEVVITQISAKTGVGFEQLLDVIEQKVWLHGAIENYDIFINQRHFDLLQKAENALQQISLAIECEDWEIVALTLREILANLGEITGKTSSVDILDTIFSKFCIGK